MISFVFLSVLFGVAFSGCPFMQQSYQTAINQAAIIGKTDNELMGNGALVGANDIGTDFFSQSGYPKDANSDFNRTITLLLAEKCFLENEKKTRGTEQRKVLQMHSNCLPSSEHCSTMPVENCPKDSLFRSITGACNNVKNPKSGKSFTPYGRIQPGSFNDGVYEMRKSVVNQQLLPGPRFISNGVLDKSPFISDSQLTANLGAVMYGQFMAHDHGSRQMYQTVDGGPTRSCCNKDYSKPLLKQPFACHAFEVPNDDPFLSKMNIQCMNYIRSQMTFPNDCKLGVAEPANFVTQYLDMSTIYGSEHAVISNLRTFKNGTMRTDAKNVLPKTCDEPNSECYISGDMRGTALFTLGIIQSIYHRLHNIIATELEKINPHWNDERIFQESKRLNSAIHQHIVYTEWLPLFVGKNETLQFQPKDNNYCGSYNENVDGSSTSEFSHCAFRIFHRNLANDFDFLDEDYKVTKTLSLDECDIGLAILETKYNQVLRGLLTKSARHSTFSDIIRNKIFNNNNNLKLGVDLLSNDILIGRDNGLQPYYIYYEFCTGKTIKSWDDLLKTKSFSASSIEDLKKMYKSVFDVDAFVGMASETIFGSSYLGTVGKCILIEQYQRTKSGDRYFYSVPNGAYPFKKEQLKFIYNFKYANVLCTATDIREVPTSAFELPSESNPMVQCNRTVDLSAWREPVRSEN